MDDHEIRLMDKRYRLPDTPHILVHPSPTARKGDFSCSLMSLSILLDYRPVDTTKHCFELSVFAEQFNEMLMRDFGYNIYKAVYNLPSDFGADDNKDADRDKDSKRDRNKTKADDEEPKEKKIKKIDDAEGKDSGKNSVKDEADSVASDKKSNDADRGDRRSTKDKERERDKEHRRDRERRISRRDDDSDGDDYSIRSGDPKRRDRIKKYTVDPDLLLSFVYFDQTHCGYIMTTHIEDLFYAIGLKLARSDIKSLKALPRWLFYR